MILQHYMPTNPTLTKIAMAIAVVIVLSLLASSSSLDSLRHAIRKYAEDAMTSREDGNATELVFALMVHRHGDRTPVKGTLQFTTPTERETACKAVQNIGFGEITKAGLQRSYRLGKFIRRRYNSLLSKRFKSSELYLRSTDVDRSQMTCLTAMAAVYPAGRNNWSHRIHWQPVPYSTVPYQYDFLYSACPNLIKNGEIINRTDMNETLSNELLRLSSLALQKPEFLRADVYKSLQSLQVTLENETVAMLPEYYRTADGMLQQEMDESDLESIKGMAAGILLEEFITNAQKIIQGEGTQKVRIYSAHDLQIYWLEAASKVQIQGVPGFCALFALELRRVVATGKFIVVPVYLPSPEEEEYSLMIEGCEDPCGFEEFKALTDRFRDVHRKWKEICGSV